MELIIFPIIAAYCDVALRGYLDPEQILTYDRMNWQRWTKDAYRNEWRNEGVDWQRTFYRVYKSA